MAEMVHHNHVIKIIALLTGIACSSYILWHTFIKGRNTLGRQSRSQRHRTRRANPNINVRNQGAQGAQDMIVTPVSHTSIPELPMIQRPVQPVSSELSPFKHSTFTPVLSQSRDLRPGKRRPVTAMVASKYHRTMTGNQYKPPADYAPTLTSAGTVVWHRLPTGNRRVAFLPRSFSPVSAQLQNLHGIVFIPFAHHPTVESLDRFDRADPNLIAADDDSDELLDEWAMDDNWEFRDVLDSTSIGNITGRSSLGRLAPHLNLSADQFPEYFEVLGE